MGKRGRILFALILILFLLTYSLLFSLPWASSELVEVVIKPGYTIKQVGDELAEKGVVRNAWFFEFVALWEGKDRDIGSGKFKLKTNMGYREALQKLIVDKKRDIFRVVIPEGFNIDQIADRLENETPFSGADFAALAYNFAENSGYWFLKERPSASLEGYLFPKTYTFRRGAQTEDIVKAMLNQFGEEVTQVDLGKMKKIGLNLHQVLTVASMIEKEVRLDQERPIVAAVIYNRLKKKMPLQIDATVRYALGDWERSLSNSDKNIRSPYNTYLVEGLPPGPICNPGLSSIKAALHPAKVDYLYYVLIDAKTGQHAFTQSYEEFLKAKQRARQKLEIR